MKSEEEQDETVSEEESITPAKTVFTRIIELIATATLILIILKSLKLIDLSWVWVLCPLWVLGFLFIVVTLVIVICDIKEEKRARKEKPF